MNERGLGGSESAVIYISKELSKLGFAVTVFCYCENEGVYDGVTYLDRSKCNQTNTKFDVLISSRSCIPFIPAQYRDQVLQESGYDIFDTYKLVENSKFKIVWLHDTFCSGDNWLEHLVVDRIIDEVWTLSDWHSNYIMNGHTWRQRYFEVLKPYIWQTRNGLRSFYSEVDILQKDKNLFVYNSSVSKGMTPLLEQCWDKIKSKIPDAKLKIIGGFYRGANHDKPDEQELQWLALKNKYDGKNGVEFTGIITPNQIANILSQASLFLQPSAFPETFGISILEAINYNTPVVCARFGALESIAFDKVSYKINYDIQYDDNQINRFVEQVCKAYYDDYLRQQKMYACNEIKKYVGWDSIALQWKQHLLNKLDLYMPYEELKKVRYINKEVQRIFNNRFLNKEDVINYQGGDTKFVIVTPVFNAAKYIEKCINSVANQMYDNYRMFVIDDMSVDNTSQVAINTLSKLPASIKRKFTVYRNDLKKSALQNQVEIIINLDPDEVVVLLDGDDWLTNESDIFSYLHEVYANGADMTYGSCHSVCDNIDLISQPYPDFIKQSKEYRKYLFNWGIPYTHLRTFKKSLFDKIDMKALFDANGDYYQAGGDGALLYALLEACDPTKIECIQRVLYNYNDANPLNDYKVNAEEQNKNRDEIIREVANNKIENLFGIYQDVMKRDPEAVKLHKDILANRDDAWIDDTSVYQIKLRQDWLIEQFAKLKIPKDAKILDVGSWTGNFINKFYEMGYHNITCVDISKSVVALGSQTFPHLKWINGDIENLEIKEQYDVIVMFEVLEHLIDPFATMKKVTNHLYPNGKLFFSIPTEDTINGGADVAAEHISVITSEQLKEVTNNFEILRSGEYFNWYMGYIENNALGYTGVRGLENHAPGVDTTKKILLALPTAKNIETDTFLSIIRLQKPSNVDVYVECFYGYSVAQVRNLIAHFAMQNHFDYVMCVDSDIVLPSDTLVKLLNADKDIISGVYIQRKPNQCIPEIYIKNPLGGLSTINPKALHKDQIMQIDGCGMGCCLIKTEVFSKIGYPQYVYHDTIDFNHTISEDIDFCIKAKNKNIEIFADTSIKCNHIGNTVFSLK